MINLLESQEKIVNEILQLLEDMNGANTEKRFSVINIIGDQGSGKSTIANEILLRLPEKWTTHQILGTSRNENTGANINTTRRIEVYPNPNFSLRLGIITLGANFRFQESDTIFHDIEKQFLKDIKRDYGYSIIFVDNYELLDDFTKKFINTISSFYRIDKLYDSFPVVFLITSKSKIYDDEEIKTFKTKDIDENDIKTISNGTLSQSQVAQIKHLSGNNLTFINMLINSKSDILSSVSQIIDKRLAEISEIGQISNLSDIEDICVCGAYFECGFTAEHVFNVINKYSINQIYELFINLNKCLILENKNNVIYFTVEDFKNAFIARRINFEHIYFDRMAKFYEKYYDYKYSTRAKFEYKLYLCNKDWLQELKTIALVFMDIVTKIYKREITVKGSIDALLSEFTEINFPEKLKKILYAVTEDKLSLNCLDELVLTDYDDILSAELTRMKLKLIPKFVYETETINNLVQSAIYYVNKLEEYNREKYLLITLQEAILSEVINHSTLYDIFDKQIDNFNKFINNYRSVNESLYKEYLNRFKRRSALYLNCDMSIRNLKDAISYFKENENIYELYNCYVNLLGLYAVSSRYNSNECKNCIKDFEKILKANKLTFAESYKYKHNKLLIGFLKSKDKCKTDKEYADLAKSYYNKYKMANSKNAINIMRLNRISLCCLFDVEQAHNEIDEFLNDLLMLRNLDHFYYINLINLNCMLYIVEKNWKKAEDVLKLITNYQIPIFNGAERYYIKRIKTLNVIIKNRIECSNILEYDKLIYDINSQGLYNQPRYIGEEAGWDFYSKSFILTDVQYFS